jgi:hypothetical protein
LQAILVQQRRFHFLPLGRRDIAIIDENIREEEFRPLATPGSPVAEEGGWVEGARHMRRP